MKNNEEVSKQRKHKEFAESLGSTLLGKMWFFLDPWDVVGMRTTTSSWNIPSKHVPHGELFFFLVKKNRLSK